MHHASTKITNSMLFYGLLMTFANSNIKGWQTTELMEAEGEWTSLVYPNPLIQHTECNRLDSSYVCDPDGILTSADADKLDLLAKEIRKKTSCTCANCPRNNVQGVSLGIFLRNNLTDYERSIRNFTTEEMTRYIRKQWHLGSCDDDIVIAVIVQEKKSHFDMGAPVLHMMPLKVAEKIFNDCLVHFETGYFSQGLRSIVNSFYDVLRRSQKKINKKSPKFTMGEIIGISLGIVFILIIAMSLIIWKRKRKNKMVRKKNNTVSRENGKNRENLEYGICEMNDAEIENSCNTSDEENSTQGKEEEEQEKNSIQKICSKQELSTLYEENKKGSIGMGLNILSSPFSKARSLEVTEL